MRFISCLSRVMIVLVISVSGSAFGARYYVSADGNDSASGLSPQNAWKTIALVNSKSFLPGDSIQFRSNDTWREELSIGSSGSAGKPVVFSRYQEGAPPRILGSNRAVEWGAVAGYPNVWRSATVLAAPRQRTGSSVSNHPSSIFFGLKNGPVQWGTMENLHLNSEGAPIDICVCNGQGAPFSTLDKEFDWCWQEDHIYVYSPQNPAERYDFVEVPQRAAAISMKTHPPQEQVVIDGFELLFALKYGFDDGWPMNVVVRGLAIQNCHIGYMGVKGAASAFGMQVWHSDMLVRNNTIHDCGRRNISYNVYGDVRTNGLLFENVVFENNTLYHGFHTTGFDISCGYADTLKNFTIRNNFIWDDPSDDPELSPNDFTSMGIYLYAGPARFTRFQVYNNILSNIKQKGVICAGLDNSEVAFNTFYGMNVRAGEGGYRAIVNVSGTTTNLNIRNNILYGNVGMQFVLSCVTFSNASHEGTAMDNNLYFQETATQRLVTINATGVSYRMADWTALKTGTGWESHSPQPANPSFIKAPENFGLAAASPARDKAQPISWIKTDFYGRPRDSLTPDIGACEFSTNAGVIHPSAQQGNSPLFVVRSIPRAVLVNTPTGLSAVVTIVNTQGRTVFRQKCHTTLKVPLASGIWHVRIQGKGIEQIKTVAVFQ